MDIIVDELRKAKEEYNRKRDIVLQSTKVYRASELILRALNKRFPECYPTRYLMNNKVRFTLTLSDKYTLKDVNLFVDDYGHILDYDGEGEMSTIHYENNANWDFNWPRISLEVYYASSNCERVPTGTIIVEQFKYICND